MTDLPITDSMRKEIVEKSAALIARASAPKGLLSLSDISALTGFARTGTVVREMLKDPAFPKPIYLGGREPRYFSGEVFRYFDRRRAML